LCVIGISAILIYSLYRKKGFFALHQNKPYDTPLLHQRLLNIFSVCESTVVLDEHSRGFHEKNLEKCLTNSVLSFPTTAIGLTRTQTVTFICSCRNLTY
jgi:hypothetical protein